MYQKTLLLVMVLAVPVLVGVSGMISFLLLRMGYSFFVWAALPFLGLSLLVAVLGFVLSRAAGRGREEASRKEPKGD